MKMGRTLTVKILLKGGDSLAMLLGCAVLCIMMGQVTWAHVGLTFPPARMFDLDFLDNIRTKPPCGMPKGEILRNNVVHGYNRQMI
jgi:hypothetical protein